MLAERDLEHRLRGLAESFDAVVPATASLEQRILSRSAAGVRPAGRPTWRRDLAVSALLLLVVAGVAIGIRELRAAPQPAASIRATPPVQSNLPTPAPSFPAADLAAAGLPDATQVTPFNLQSTSNGRTITLIGAYADPARIVLLLRLAPAGGFPSNVQVHDSQGFINAGTSGTAGIPGDEAYVVESGPHAAADGLAHLEITILSLSSPGRVEQSQWHFAIQIPVQPSIALSTPRQFRIGAWTVTIEVAEQTPTVIHLQAVIDGTDVPGAGNAVTFLDPTGRTIVPGCAAGITVPKAQQQVPVTRARVYCEFPVPKTPGLYHIRFAGSGGVYEIPITIQ